MPANVPQTNFTKLTKELMSNAKISITTKSTI